MSEERKKRGYRRVEDMNPELRRREVPRTCPGCVAQGVPSPALIGGRTNSCTWCRRWVARLKYRTMKVFMQIHADEYQAISQRISESVYPELVREFLDYEELPPTSIYDDPLDPVVSYDELKRLADMKREDRDGA